MTAELIIYVKRARKFKYLVSEKNLGWRQFARELGLHCSSEERSIESVKAVFGQIGRFTPNPCLPSYLIPKVVQLQPDIVEFRPLKKKRKKSRQKQTKQKPIEWKDFVGQFISWAVAYKQYLKTKHWKAIRSNKLLQANYTCEECKAEHDLQVHHLHYNSLFKEQLEDLKVLCNYCHKLVHGLIEGKPKKVLVK